MRTLALAVLARMAPETEEALPVIEYPEKQHRLLFVIYMQPLGTQ